MKELRITVPLEPISVNHYKSMRIIQPREGKPFISTYVTKVADDYMDAVAICAAGRQIRAKAYAVAFCVYQGHGSRGDVDNYSKCVLDGLVKAGVIHSDSAITDLSMSKRRDRANPRTEIVVREAGQLGMEFAEDMQLLEAF
jgi:Holliday junction resolvase RusA-like endonuclease